MSKTNRPIQQRGRRSAKKTKKKAAVHPFTEFEGDLYTGARTAETWTLGKGNWEEQRTGPQSWEIVYETTAVKPGKTGTLPRGSEYHSYVLAHQKLVKTRSNGYQMRLEGIKFKLAHKEAGDKWSANSGARKRTLIKMLTQMLNDLEMGHGKAPSESRKAAPAPTDAPGEARRTGTRKRRNPKD